MPWRLSEMGWRGQRMGRGEKIMGSIKIERIASSITRELSKIFYEEVQNVLTEKF